jgi:hypothetical protein
METQQKDIPSPIADQIHSLLHPVAGSPDEDRMTSSLSYVCCVLPEKSRVPHIDAVENWEVNF